MRQWAKAECMQSALADLWANHTGQSMGGFNGAKGAKPSPQTWPQQVAAKAF